MAGTSNTAAVGSLGYYNNLLNNGNTGSSNSSDTTGGKSGSSIWDSLFSNLGGILIGTGGLVTAIKADPNQIAAAQAQQPIYIPGLGNTGMSGSTLLIIGIVILVLVAVVIMAMRKNG